MQLFLIQDMNSVGFSGRGNIDFTETKWTHTHTINVVVVVAEQNEQTQSRWKRIPQSGFTNEHAAYRPTITNATASSSYQQQPQSFIRLLAGPYNHHKLYTFSVSNASTMWTIWMQNTVRIECLRCRCPRRRFEHCRPSSKCRTMKNTVWHKQPTPTRD